MRVDKKPIEFLWDRGNSVKNTKHNVTDGESEEVFLDKNKKTFTDTVHSQHEERLRVVGKTRKGRLLFVVFTKRDIKIRIISARDVNRKEVSLYEEEISTAKIQK